MTNKLRTRLNNLVKPGSTQMENDIFVQFDVQWGSEIQKSLDFQWSKRGWVLNGLDFKWDLKSGSPTI